jgi:hypothetical protein
MNVRNNRSTVNNVFVEELVAMTAVVAIGVVC